MTKLLNPAYAAIKKTCGGTRIGGGVTAPRGSTRASPRSTGSAACAASAARLDAYAHNPYPINRFQTPSIGECGHCMTITMASLERLQREVKNAWGGRSGSG